MSDDKPIDPNLLKRMMMGEFSANSFQDNNLQHNKSKNNIELDLHFDKLYPTKSFLTSNKKLNLQLEAVNEFIESSKKNSVRFVYVIYGKGEGVLKKKLITHLSNLKIRHSIIADPPYFGNALKLSL